MWEIVVEGGMPTQNLTVALVWHVEQARLYAACAHDDMLSLWDLKDTARQVASLEHETESDIAVCYDPRDKSLLIANNVSDQVSFFSLKGDKLAKVKVSGKPTFDGATEVGLCYDAAGKRMLLSTPGAIWEMGTKLKKIADARFDGMDDDEDMHINSMTYDPKRKSVVVCGVNAYARLAGDRLSAIPHKMDRTHWGFCSSAYSPELQAVVSFAGDGDESREAFVIDETITSARAKIPTYWERGSLVYHPGLQSLVVAGNDSTDELGIWQMSSLTEAKKITVRPSPAITNYGRFVSGKQIYRYEDGSGELHRFDGDNFVLVATKSLGNGSQNPMMAQDTDGTLYAFNEEGELWRLAGSTWKRLATGKTGPKKRRAAAFAISAEGPFLFGGEVGSKPARDAWVFREKKWMQVGKKKPPPARSDASACSMPDGRVLMWGGNSRNKSLDDGWLFDGQEWEKLPVKATFHGAHGHVDAKSGALLSNNFKAVIQFLKKETPLLELPKFPDDEERSLHGPTFCGFDESTRSFFVGAAEGSGQILRLPLHESLDDHGAPPFFASADATPKKPAASKKKASVSGKKTARPASAKAQKLKIKKQGQQLLVSAGKASATFRHVEISRQREAEGAADLTNDRVEAELHMRLSEACGAVPAEKWVTVLNMYCRDSYDGEYELVVESSDVYGAAFSALKTLLGPSASPVALLGMIGPKTNYPEGYSLMLRVGEIDEVEAEGDDTIVIVKGP